MISKRVLVIAAALLALSATSVMAQQVNVDDFIVNNLIITGNGQLNVINSGIATTTPTTTIRDYVVSGYAGGSWNGLGINSKAAADDASGNAILALGMVNGDDALNVLNLTNFQGHDVHLADSLILATTYGDADLSGVTNGDDYYYIDSSIDALNHGLTVAASWANGDFNYDGVINGDDYYYIDSVIDYNNHHGAAASAAASAAVVPEPSTLIMGLLAFSCFIGIRKFW
jgi:hypothetical protein